MKGVVTLALIALSLTGCRADDVTRAFGPDRVWTLKQLNGAPFAAGATLTFPTTDEIAGAGPCNRYFGAMNASYPQFSVGPIGSTRMACPDMAAETAFFAALDLATQANASNNTLTLSGPDGLEMVFTATE